MTTIMFEGIDSWNRPIFKDVSSKNRYGSVDILFSHYDVENDVLDKVSEKDLVFFGNSFDCEPMGTTPGNLKIVQKEIKLKIDGRKTMKNSIVDLQEYCIDSWLRLEKHRGGMTQFEKGKAFAMQEIGRKLEQILFKER